MNTLAYKLDIKDSASVALYVSHARRGDVNAFEALHKVCRQLICSIALAITKDVHASEDVAQQVFINAWQNLDKLKNDHSFLPWLRQTARYKALNVLREKSNLVSDNDESLEQLLAHHDCPDSDLLKDEQVMLMNQLVSALPEESREILILYYREEQSSKQVAALLDISEEKVRQQLSRSRKKLKSQYLNRFGTLAISTITPAVALGLVAPSAPVAAATLVTNTTYSSPILKLFAVLGGAFIGAFAAMLAVFYSMKFPIKYAKTEQTKTILKVMRTRMLITTFVFGVLFVMSYSFSSGWIMPTLAYSAFALILGIQIFQAQNIINKDQQHMTKSEVAAKPFLCRPKSQKLFGRIGLVLGFASGGLGLVMGLIGSGRLVL
ncbi:RNA polymerase subunit sigma-70 [Pseudoalteromonas phenolica]|uniref:RNA polymerase subunit sigma-70 n=1 Tax=Pseudoalteromonas phenolica TaxID=161398 RepID=A0A4Q7IKN9_9GAMM|nr:sigma-70 family RNA polymerase sigma factor [Pseudoalteromonas phenolica]RZQ52215.1 RNA polymerase subunit sigma-70 [Pseudoalteromonas phenolica]